jgi:ABC-type antimicrobial peptide transport system permease subunit
MSRFLSDARLALRGFRKRPLTSVLVVVTLAVGQALQLTVAGLLLGGVLGFLGVRTLSSVLQGAVTFSPATFALLTAALAAASLLAAFVPARRALRVDPALALRAE